MVTTKKKPTSGTSKKDYSDISAIYELWNSITELKQASSEYFKTKEGIDPDDDIYYEISQEHSKISQQYVDSIFELWKYARSTGAEHSRGEKIYCGEEKFEIAELIPVFDEANNFLKWDYLLMAKNEAGEITYRPFITAVPQGDVTVFDSVIGDQPPPEPEAIAPEPEPEQLTLLPNELGRDLGNDYLAFKANQLIDLLEKFPREAIAINNILRVGAKSDPEIVIQTSRGNICCWMDDLLFMVESDDVDTWFTRFDSAKLKPWEDNLNDYLDSIGLHKDSDADPVKIKDIISDPPYEYQDTGDGRYEIFHRVPLKPHLPPIRLGFIWEDQEGWIADDLLPAEKSRRAIAYRLHQKFKEREGQDKQKIRELVAKTRQAVAKKTKAVTELKTPGFLGKKAITESKSPAKKSKPVTESKPRAIADKKKPITELKPASVNSVISTDGKPQGCINWSAPAGGAKVPAGTKYPYYCYHEGGKLRRCYIGGGNQQATIAQSRVRAVEEAIAQSKTPDEIVSLIHELKRG